jgi:hypothetical protein
MEFSVNLSKLGLDYLVTSGNPCGMPFRKILVKSRAATSFSAELKDFVGPFDFFRAPRADASASVPFFCGTSGGSSTITVNNALPTSLYTWTTPNGTIVGDNVGPSINVSSAGMYIVSQELMDSCGVSYAKDTVTITNDPLCVLLKTDIKDFKADVSSKGTLLSWLAYNNGGAKKYELERSNGKDGFTTIGNVPTKISSSSATYNFLDYTALAENTVLYYRLKITDLNGNIQYSRIVSVNVVNDKPRMQLYTGSGNKEYHLQVSSLENEQAEVTIFNIAGSKLRSLQVNIQDRSTLINLGNFNSWKAGVYVVKLVAGNNTLSEKMIVLN